MKFVRMLSTILAFLISVIKIILPSSRELKINNIIGYLRDNFKNLLLKLKIHLYLN